MYANRADAPTPDLRIVHTESVLPHEEHDSQRSQPLIERLRYEEVMINPPVVAPMDGLNYVILDGANRCYAFEQLKYPHILVQIAPYESGHVDLLTWRHVVCAWNPEAFLEQLAQVRNIELVEKPDEQAIAQIILKDERFFAVRAPVKTTHERNAALREVVGIYQRNAVLHRTALTDPDHIWPLFPDAIALVLFPQYQPADIMAAAQQKAFLPPGISRHIVHGRAIHVNFPLAKLRDENTRLAEKNRELMVWLQQKLANRKIRYYAEATYQFDE